MKEGNNGKIKENTRNYIQLSVPKFLDFKRMICSYHRFLHQNLNVLKIELSDVFVRHMCINCKDVFAIANCIKF